jgi:SAM-dependent methyltransferase
MASDPWKHTLLNLMPGRPPWCPSREDGLLMREMANRALGSSGKGPRVLVLGVTPQIIQLDWPHDAELAAVDSSSSMIASNWRLHRCLASFVVCARWQVLPFANASFDAIVGDGSLNALPDLDEYGKVLHQAARALRPGGALVLRCFIKPKRMEAPEQVVLQARQGGFSTTSEFRLRFAFAAADAGGRVALAQLRDSFNALVADRGDFARATGWPRQEIDYVDIDKDSRIGLTFPTGSQLQALSEPFFRIERLERGTYAQSEHCPTILFQPL